MAGFDRYNNVLTLFLTEQASWTVAELSEAIGTSPSNVYRTVRELVEAGFVESTKESRYRLGPTFLEFEHRLRETDPLVRSGGVFLRTLVEQAGQPCVAVLARLYGRQVMCVAEAHTLDQRTSYERGKPMPIVRGATSKAILASMTTRKRKKLLAEVHDGEAAVPDELVAELTQIRRAGLSVSRGEVDDGLMGIAVPVTNDDLAINASLSFVVRQADTSEVRVQRLSSLLRAHATLIENFMAEAQSDMRADQHDM
ncbi:hypothetical protein CVM52_06560 [Pseudooceanicola lipolyticus]|uniref:IclR family transcriptional regulator n=1 Tax=Pseudooceanicola lipolyticus TaxID=2029104 RepID=A0A2M8J429_9RHOB|nr:IclR family transcriptional regulator C-terminal domain-containing protein [Pseudooceanicola lipolyticus]PJE37528.1 hypothetical protein CVM52_06560 [Pseudooceanicola lipolyticus]